MTIQPKLLSKAAKEFSAKDALIYYDCRISYSELERLSSSVASQLLSYVKKGDVIAILMQNIPQFVILQHAAWKLGCTILPLNPSFSVKEIKYCLLDSNAKAAVAQPDALERVREAVQQAGNIKVLCTNPTTFSDVPSELFQRWGFIEGEEELDFSSNEILPSAEQSEDDVAVLMYTSGTTGTPKGAMITYRNIYAASTIYKKWFRFTHNDMILGFAPFFHVTGLIFHLATSLLSGACVVMGGRFDSGLVLETVQKKRTTATMMAATAYLALLNNQDIHDTDMSSMRLWSSGGMPVTRKLEEEWKDLTNKWIYVAWGLTETTSPATLWPYPYDGPLPVDKETGIVSSGRAVYDTSLKILDENGLEVPEGFAGEIIVKGPQVITGYLNKPDDNKKTFREGWLYTGDIAKIKDGWVYIIDRKKDLINTSGFKVWPREVEEVLYMHQCVAEAAVIGVQDQYRGEAVKAFIKLKEGCRAESVKDELLNLCRKYLAPYKVPRQIEFIKEIPKTSTGKILKRALKEGTYSTISGY